MKLKDPDDNKELKQNLKILRRYLLHLSKDEHHNKANEADGINEIATCDNMEPRQSSSEQSMI